jgi:hypothetical protein
MLKNYAKELTAIAAVFGLISYTVYVCAAEPVKTKPVVVTAPKPAAKKTPPALGVVEGKEVKKPVAKEVKKPAGKEVTTPDPKKDPNRKKPTLKAKYADKK